MSADQLNWLLNLFLSMQLSIAVLVIVSIGLAVVFGMMGTPAMALLKKAVVRRADVEGEPREMPGTPTKTS